MCTKCVYAAREKIPSTETNRQLTVKTNSHHKIKGHRLLGKSTLTKTSYKNA